MVRTEKREALLYNVIYIQIYTRIKGPCVSVVSYLVVSQTMNELRTWMLQIELPQVPEARILPIFYNGKDAE